ncbi:thymidylate kinase-domain-containing protein [Dunaliella salina]|uniref:dTMP kinase n=1 Tax=Dunaliella salina TaxID=3046 RepID=A0ABQ7H667_DUNSA|nr:thymidylate kinase-domain-containing protein [Dunaliella salina]|eukprot:KAF5842354.1 thymidylate kinase-domain-containing protein [Dunaliella salina]
MGDAMAALQAMAKATSSTEQTPPRGAFIVFEGVDRCGKTTQCNKLMEHLKAKDLSAELWRFPDRSTESGKRINAYLAKEVEMSDEEVHLLFAQNRWEKRQTLLDKLAAGTTLVVDRYAYSGIAYSSAKGKDTMSLEWCKAPDQTLPAPDLVLYLEVSAEAAKARGGFGGERYETADFQEKVAEMFEQQKNAVWVSLDADDSPDEVHDRVKAEVDRTLTTLKDFTWLPVLRLNGQLESDFPAAQERAGAKRRKTEGPQDGQTA